jgi:F-type H+-transporting ATPase subunit alpha
MNDWQREVEATLRQLTERSSELGYRLHTEEIGRVRRVGDSVAFVEGLAEVSIGELVVFGNGASGQVIDLDRDLAGCILFGSGEGVESGSPVFRSGQPPSMPVGDAVLGRVLDALGQPRDGRGPIGAVERREIEQDAPGVLQRQPVREPLFTGIKAIDAAVPIGLGQRELILGDRQTGKTSIALDTIINQRDSGVVCVYACIGGRRVTAREVLEELDRSGAMGHTVMVDADASEAAPLRYLAPYSACAVAEWFAYQGRPALVVYDDLGRHAEAYRDISLLLRRPPSREAYPGDIFYLHARLMERSFRLHDSLGGGSVTALPILETQRGQISAFISTNLISMTDGQLYLSGDLFAEGHLPAIDVGRSVSRVGGTAQPATMRTVASDLRLELSQYDEVKGFARFGAILDAATKQQLDRGERLTAMLMQGERQPVPFAVQVTELWALMEGLLEDVPGSRLPTLERALVQLAGEYAGVEGDLRARPEVDETLGQAMRTWIDAAKARAGEESAADAGRP